MRGQHAGVSRWAIVVAAALLGATPVGAQPAAGDTLSRDFANPPASAHPRVWWHWMGGNVSKEGIRLDMEWMKRVGIAGMQNFDGDLRTRVYVDKPLIWMTPPWKDVFRFAAQEADRLGLELTEHSSGGWSETGAPWVMPAEAMKKVAWSTTIVTGGPRNPIVLARPPAAAGPFQDILSSEADGLAPFYVDAQVFAYRLPADAEPDGGPPAKVTSSAGPIDAAALSDGRLAPMQQLPFGPDHTRAWIRLDYAQPRTVRSISLGMPGGRGYGNPLPPHAWLEASDDGVEFRKVTDLPATDSLERSETFPAVTARSFRVMFQSVSGPRPGEVEGAPGAFVREFPPAPSTYGVSELVLRRDARVHRFEEKAGFATVGDYYTIDTPPVPATSVVPHADIVDLTGKMSADGRLDWTPPPGRWAVVRLGYSLTGKHNHPATPASTGLEVDKLNAGHVRHYMDEYLGRFADTTGPELIGKAGLRGLLTDSTEVGPQNWTEDMLGEFQRRRGYDARPWLPTLTGVIVESPEASDRFLFDFRRTIAELVEVAHYKQVADSAHQRGLIVYGESLEGGRPQLGDDIAMRRYTDLPMAAMWVWNEKDGPRPALIRDDLGAASVAHVYGQNLTAAESLTAAGFPWAMSPRDLKTAADLELVLGINRFVIHTSIHQPFVDRKPGLTLATELGQYFNRNETWAEQADAWVSYLARSSYLLQQGHFVADVAYFYGEEAPANGQPIDVIPPGRGFDFVNSDAVLNRLSVEDGWLTTESGMRYRVLYLGGSSRRMTLPVLRRVEALARAGAVIVGDKPADTPSLSDDRAAFAGLADRLWEDAAAPHGHSIGAGRILAGRSVDQALVELGLPRDVAISGAPETEILSAHRRLADGEIYFLTNRKNRPETVEVAFRTAGKRPQLWRAETGAETPLSYRTQGDRTLVPLTLAPHDAVFVVFREPATAPTWTAPAHAERALMTFDGPWTVAFEAGRGAPPSAVLPTLTPWNENVDPGVRYFSGVGTYSRSFEAPKAWLGASRRVELDLGEVDDLAEVWLNGKRLGVVWHAPYRIDLTPALRAGANKLEVRVVNLWVNRLIGDAQPGVKKVTFTEDQPYQATAPLRRSGLSGPVRLVGVE